ncbi:MAG: hypothetical protein P4L46_26535 [Fimbriimonas sp.]|nr:hypothetical protein [Fimbriimonas sp.]
MTGLALAVLGFSVLGSSASPEFKGANIQGSGDRAYLRALDEAYAMLQPSARVACLPMLYNRDWNGFVEGPTWNAWWIQNSFGPSYTMMPFLTEPYTTWLTNAQAMWFKMMGDGKHKDFMGAVGPVGCLCDAATPDGCWYRQGDGNVAIHDWCIGFTEAGLILECELLLTKRDRLEIARMLPKLETVAAFLDSRRDPKRNLLLGGVASDLLAPSYGGWLQPDGSRGKAFLSELSVNYVAGLDRLIEVCKLAGKPDRAAVYAQRRDLVKQALPQLMTPEGYFVQALLPDGARQGVYGASKSGFFETAPNHDAMCFRVVNDAQAGKIYRKIRSIPELRPHDLILPNYPSYDNMYESNGLFSYGVWVNGGHWTTAEARMMMGYYRVDAQADALKAFNRIDDLAIRYRADNNLTDRGAKLYQPGQPYNVVYDCWGAPGALLRGLFEYVYTAEGIRLYPHIPTSITRIAQKFPVRFGKKRLYLSAAGVGRITGVRVNGKAVAGFDSASVLLRLDDRSETVRVEIQLGGAKPFHAIVPPAERVAPHAAAFWRIREFDPPRSSDQNPLCIGRSPSGSYGFKGQMKGVRIFRRVLSEAEIASEGSDEKSQISASLDKLLASYPLDVAIQGPLSGGLIRELTARFDGPRSPKIENGGLALDGDSGLVVRPSLAIDFQDDFTLEAWIRPEALPSGGSRLIDRCTVGAADGYNFDFINSGRTLRLINVTGTVEAPVELQIGAWQHVAATCDKSGLMKLYLNGRLVGETQGAPISATAPGGPMPSLAAIAKFAKAMDEAGLGDTYLGSHARTVVRMVESLQAHRRQTGWTSLPLLPGTPPAKPDSVDELYASVVDKLALGLVDSLKKAAKDTSTESRSAIAIAKRVGLF